MNMDPRLETRGWLYYDNLQNELLILSTPPFQLKTAEDQDGELICWHGSGACWLHYIGIYADTNWRRNE